MSRYVDEGDGYNAMGLKITGGRGGRNDYVPDWGVDATQRSDAATAARAGVEATLHYEVSSEPVNSMGLRVTGYRDGQRRGPAPKPARPGPPPSAAAYQGTEGTFQREDLHKRNMAATGIRAGTVKAARNAAFGGGADTTTAQPLGGGLTLYTTKHRDPIKFEFEIENTGGAEKALCLDLSASSNLKIVLPPRPPGGAASLRVQLKAPAGMQRTVVAVAEPAGYGAVTLAANALVDEDAGGAATRAATTAVTPGQRQGETVKTKKIGDVATLSTYTLQRPPGFRWEIESLVATDIEFSLDLSGSENVTLTRPAQGAGADGLKVTVTVAPRQTLEVAAAAVGAGARASVRTAMSVRQLAAARTAQPPPPAASAKHMVADYDYAPTQGDEVELQEGDEVFVQHENGDGWAQVVNARTGATGLAPLNYLKAYDPETHKQKSYDPATNGAIGQQQHTTGVSKTGANRAEDWTSDGGAGSTVMCQGRKCIVLGETDGTCMLQTLDTREVLEAPASVVHPLPSATAATTKTSTVRREVTPARVEARVEFRPAPGERRVIPGIRVDPRTGEVRNAAQPGRGAAQTELLRAGLHDVDRAAIPKMFR